MAIWDDFITEQDRQVIEASGFGAFHGVGQRPVLVVVDVTYGMTGDDPQAGLLESIARWRTSCGPYAWAAIPHLQRLIDGFRQRRLPVVYTKGLPRRADGFGKRNWRSSRLGEIAPVNGRTGQDIVDEVAPQESDIVIEKPGPSAFFSTPMVAYLTALGADSVVVCGSSTSGCVRATVVDAFSSNYGVVVAEEATFDRAESSHAIALFDIESRYGDVMPVDDILSEVRKLPADLFADRIGQPLGS